MADPVDNSGSILTLTKKALGLPEDYTPFDADVTIHINSVFNDLNDLGIGPDEGFEIVDKTTLWSAYIGTDKNLNRAKSYMYMRVRLLFDPPPTSFGITALKEQIKEAEWRMNVKREDEKWTDPTASTTS